MKPVDHVTPVAPANWVRRPEDKRKKPDQGGRREPEPRQQPPRDPDDRARHIDELA